MIRGCSSSKKALTSISQRLYTVALDPGILFHSACFWFLDVLPCAPSMSSVSHSIRMTVGAASPNPMRIYRTCRIFTPVLKCAQARSAVTTDLFRIFAVARHARIPKDNPVLRVIVRNVPACSALRAAKSTIINPRASIAESLALLKDFYFRGNDRKATVGLMKAEIKSNAQRSRISV
jgi:hypothetical protein